MLCMLYKLLKSVLTLVVLVYLHSRYPPPPSRPGCTSRWRMVRAGVGAYGAEPYPAARTLDQCQQACERRPGCVAVDVDTGNPVAYCWIHTDQNDLANTYTSSTVTQYRLDRCPSKL